MGVEEGGAGCGIVVGVVEGYKMVNGRYAIAKFGYPKVSSRENQKQNHSTSY